MSAELLTRGRIVWVDLSPARRREQQGHRPALVICNDDYLRVVPDLVSVVPLTTTDRGWPHHVAVRGSRTDLPEQSFAMTEQPRTIARQRISKQGGMADETTLSQVDRWLRDFLDPP